MKNAIKRIINIDMKRIKELNLENQGIFIEFDEDNIMKAKALIIGPKDTLYENAFLLFSITFPNNYPFSPPDIKYHSQNNIRIHPNIYTNGKICLSILGTWSGPSWTTAMDIINVLITIQSLLDNNPLQNEPGYENNKHNTNIYKNYNKIIQYNTINSLIINRLKIDLGEFTLFRDIIHQHFKENKDEILSKIDINIEIKEEVKIGIYRIHALIDYNRLKKKYMKLINNI